MDFTQIVKLVYIYTLYFQLDIVKKHIENG